MLTINRAHYSLIFLLALSVFPLAHLIAEDDNKAETTQKPSMQTVNILQRGGKLALQLRTVSRCMFGDLDAIYWDMIHKDPSKPGKLLLSIEPIQSSDRTDKSLSRSIDIANATEIMTDPNGSTVLLELPEVDKPKLFGLFVCIDTTGDEVCANKETRTVNNVLREYTQGGRSDQDNQSESPSDGNYFFAPLLIKENAVSVLSREMSDQRYAEFKKQIGEQLGSTKQAELALLKIKTTNDTLASEPLGIEDNRLIVTLPRMDPGKCG